MTDTRICKQCGKTKPLELFPKDPRMSQGRRRTCKDCHNEKCRKNREKRGAKPYKPKKRCGTCHTSKPLYEFAKSAKSKDGHQYTCHACTGGRSSRGTGYRRIEHRSDDFALFTYGHLAERLEARDVTQAEWAAIRDAVEHYGSGEEREALAAKDPDGSRGLYSLAICIGEGVKARVMTLRRLPKTVKAAKRMTGDKR